MLACWSTKPSEVRVQWGDAGCKDEEGGEAEQALAAEDVIACATSAVRHLVAMKWFRIQSQSCVNVHCIAHII